MYIIRLVLIFLLLVPMSACLKNYSSESSSQQEENQDPQYRLFLYKYENHDDKEYICQYKCRLGKLFKESCDKYYVEFSSSNLDDTTLDIVKNPSNYHVAHKSPKSFSHKNMEALFNLKANNDTQDICDYSNPKEGAFIKLSFNTPFFIGNDFTSFVLTETTNPSWDKYLVYSYYIPDEIQTVFYNKKNKEILSINDGIVDYDLVINSTSIPLAIKKDMLKHYEYLGLSKDDCIRLDSNTVFSIASGYTFSEYDMESKCSSTSGKIKIVQRFNPNKHQEEKLFFTHINTLFREPNAVKFYYIETESESKR